jgi:hypothetical protein
MRAKLVFTLVDNSGSEDCHFACLKWEPGDLSNGTDQLERWMHDGRRVEHWRKGTDECSFLISPYEVFTALAVDFKTGVCGFFVRGELVCRQGRRGDWGKARHRRFKDEFAMKGCPVGFLMTDEVVSLCVS